MQFAPKSWSGGSARAGVIHLAGCSIETPALLLSTHKGLPAFISTDLLASLPTPDSRLLQVSPLHFVEGPSQKVISDLGGLHKMLGLEDYFLTSVPRDSIVCVSEWEGTNKLGASFETLGGRRLIRPADYTKMISSMKPDLWVTLADEVPASVSIKRNKMSVDRTVRWLDECIALSPVRGAVFGSIVGGSDVDERKRCAKEVARRTVSGYWIGGFGLGESSVDRPALLGAIVLYTRPGMSPRNCYMILQQNLCFLHLHNLSCCCVFSLYRWRPASEKQICCRTVVQTESSASEGREALYGPGPRIIYKRLCHVRFLDLDLQGIAAGIDLFDSTYIHHNTVGGYALAFEIEVLDKGLGGCPQSHGAEIDLKEDVYRKDATPIVEDCSCYTCQNHTKAYINHLLNVREMLAQILLEIHNTFHLLRFFRSIRKAIREDRFEVFCKAFMLGRGQS